MMLTRVIVVLVVCVGLGSCLTCYHCQHHQPQNCSPLICADGEACNIHHDKWHKGRRNHDHVDVALPNGCKNASECELNQCCSDDDCVEKVMAAAKASPFTHSVQITTTSAPVCKDEVVSFLTNCHDLASTGACLESVGVHVCQKTCGLCDYLESTYGDQGYCRDMLANNQCAKQNICADSFAIQLCPYTCGLCAVKLQNVINEFLHRTTSTAAISTMTTTTTPCVDTIENNGCASLHNVCQDGIAHLVCPRFCNLCG